MRRLFGFKFLTALLALAGALSGSSAVACAMCYNSNVDSPLAKGMNWGIFSLLAVVICVLGTIASFFVYLGKRADSVNATGTSDDSLPPTNKA